MQAALALPVLALPLRAGAAESGEVGVAVLAYRERDLMRVNELTREQALAHVAHANEEWARRSAHPWTQDTSWLQARS